MSAAEPANPGPDRAPTATVIPLIRSSTAARPPRRDPRRERPHVPQQPQSDLTPHEKVAAWIEDFYAKHHRSLTSSDTAQDFLIAVRGVRVLFQGAYERGLVEEEAYRELDAMLEGLMAAPGLLA